MFCPVCNTDNPPSCATCRACGSPCSPMEPSSHVHTLPPGSKLGRGTYSVGKLLGQGGFGITYLGSDTQLRRPVAIKEFFPQGSLRQGLTVQPTGGMTHVDFLEAKGKFVAEAETLARFQHPSIVHVYSSFQENNTAYMVMEYLKGQTLQSLLEKQGSLPETEAVAYILQVAQALAIVHGAQILHRDIKPDNILLTDDRRIVLIDFGSAREFTAGKTKRMTAMLTPGYAPLEQYGHQAKFNIPTDIYSLGATLYHLLTGQFPVAATDRATGVALSPPHRENSAISRVVSDAVMWAMDIKVDRRPQSVNDFLSALNGAATKPSTGVLKGRDPSSLPQSNPYVSRLRQLVQEIQQPSPDLPAHPHDKRIQEIRLKLDAQARYTPQPEGRCPCCHKTDLSRVTGQVDGRCVVCRNAVLQKRNLDISQCPVCRTGKLVEATLDRTFFCPVCRKTPLSIDRQKILGVTVKTGLKCGNCAAQFQAASGSKIRLLHFHSDPHGIGTQYANQALEATQWQNLSRRRQQYLQCDLCSAQLDIEENDCARLQFFATDPFGIGNNHNGVAYFRIAWAKLAQGLPLSAGNIDCPGCNAKYNYDAGRQSLILLDANTARFPQLQPWIGKPQTTTTWYLFAAGKRSLKPGLMCFTCKTEFDGVQGKFQLVWASTKQLSKYTTTSHSMEDWNKLASGFLTNQEQAILEKEARHLSDIRQADHGVLVSARALRQKQLDVEITHIFRRSILEGRIPITLKSRDFTLTPSEIPLWEGTADRWKMRSSQGTDYWDREGSGTLVVTSERLLFKSPLANWTVWKRPLKKLWNQAITSTRWGQTMLLLSFEGLQKPVGLVVQDISFNVTLDGHSREMTMTLNDLSELLRTLSGTT